jgi:hypothetical protein
MDLNLNTKQKTIDTYILSGKINNKEVINNLIYFVKNNEDKELYNVTNVKGNFTGFKSGITNKDFHSFLKLIQPAIKVVYKNNFCVFDAWGNILKAGGEVLEHDHIGTTAFCGIIYLSNSGHGTYFRDYDLTIEEEIGKFVLFHPYLKHSVKKIEKDVERITFAFNCNVLNTWTFSNEKKINWINKNEI